LVVVPKQVYFFFKLVVVPPELPTLSTANTAGYNKNKRFLEVLTLQLRFKEWLVEG